MGWAGHVARISERRNAYRVWRGDMRPRDHLEDLCIDGTLILKWIFNKWDGVHLLHWSGSGEGQVAGSCECGDELPGFINCGEFPD